MYFRTGSSSDSLPSRASSSTAAAVNCFETDPASKIVSGRSRRRARGPPCRTPSRARCAPLSADADRAPGRRPVPLGEDRIDAESAMHLPRAAVAQATGDESCCRPGAFFIALSAFSMLAGPHAPSRSGLDTLAATFSWALGPQALSRAEPACRRISRSFGRDALSKPTRNSRAPTRSATQVDTMSTTNAPTTSHHANASDRCWRAT